jgi:DNA-binding MarR family transcriptional regulator
MALSLDSCPSSDDRVVLFGLLLETNARLSRDLGAELENECAVPLAWFEVLLRLRQSPNGQLKMNEVAEAIVHSSGGTTRLIDRLESAGFVRREQCASDRRAVHVAITDEGGAKLDEALPIHVDYLQRRIAARLNDAELETLSTLLTKLNN